MYAGVWRYASSRDALRAAAAVAVSGVAALGLIVLTQPPLGDFSSSVFMVDALICTARDLLRALRRASDRDALNVARRGDGRRVLIVGAGRTGRSLLRELRETPGERVVGFVDDNAAIRGRRLNGVRVIGGTASIEAALERTHPDVVIVTIPDAPRERLDTVVRACEARELACRFVTREIEVDPRVILGAERS